MKEHRIAKIIKIVLIAIVALAVFGFVVRELWNYLMPGIFGLPAITFGQGLGLLVLSKLLFGGFRGGFRGGPGRGMHWRRRMSQRWAGMSEEERQRFSQGMNSCFGRERKWAGRRGPMRPDFREQPTAAPTGDL